MVWFRNPGMLQRLIADIVRTEVRRMRPGAELHVAQADTYLDERGVGFDSLERLTLATAVSAFFGLSSDAGRWRRSANSIADWADIVAASSEQGPEALTFRTSGTFGSPKWHQHTLAGLEQEAAWLATLLGPAARVFSVVPSHHIYGFLFTILLPQFLGNPAVHDLRAELAGGLQASFRRGDLVIAFPYWWNLASGVVSWPVGVVGVTSTGPLRPTMARALADAGLSRLVDVHGSTETGGIGWRDSATGPYALMPFWGKESDHLVRMNESGAPLGSIEAPDELVWLDERHYRVAGRRDGAVQVGGVNVYPAKVREVLLSHPDVADAAVRLMRPDEGDRLKAFIVPKASAVDRAAMRAGLERLAIMRLSPAERPRAYSFGCELPTTALSKLGDWPVDTES